MLPIAYPPALPTAAALVRMFRTDTEDGGEDDAAGAAGLDGGSSLSKWSDDWKVRAANAAVACVEGVAWRGVAWQAAASRRVAHGRSR
jgi:hypothetical protein